jgi:hypothetical protein
MNRGMPYAESKYADARDKPGHDGDKSAQSYSLFPLASLEARQGFTAGRELPYSDLSMFQKIGVAGPSSTPVRDLRHALGALYCPSGM